ncbi:hypothetical protein CFP56_021617 [Quercus suber]|uniref:Uncharacterized protein n=1 Tax=Quercus suber TaxID=58331 RepID=A0AAW0M250_QUESU
MEFSLFEYKRVSIVGLDMIHKLLFGRRMDCALFVQVCLIGPVRTKPNMSQLQHDTAHKFTSVDTRIQKLWGQGKEVAIPFV